MPWWAQNTSSNDRHLYVGHAPYRMTDWHNWPATELPRQVRRNRTTQGCQGSVYFRLRNGVLNNPKGFLDSLRTDLYHYPAIAPAMLWKDDIPPNPPLNVSFGINEESTLLSWTAPALAEDGDAPQRFVIYRSSSLPVDAADPANIFAIISGDSTSYPCEPSGDYFYAISALDRLNNESVSVQIAPSGIDKTHKPESTVLLSNYPNPFNPSTTIRFQLPEYSWVNISIFNLQGSLVKTLDVSPGQSGELHWDGSNESGQTVSAGVYICQLRSEHYVSSLKLVLLR